MLNKILSKHILVKAEQNILDNKRKFKEIMVENN
jgi:hypothetical protein